MSDRSNRRLTLFAILVTALLLVLLGRAAVLSVRDGAQLASAAAQNDTQLQAIPAARGLILDQTGVPLAGNQGGVTLQVTPVELPDGPRRERTLARVADLMGEPTNKLEQRLLACGSPGAAKPPICHLGNPGDPVVLPATAQPKALQSVAEQPERFPGVSLVSVVRRTYPAMPVRASHVLGYLGQVSAEELAQNPALPRDTFVGRTGLEKQYDSVLRGTPGGQRLDASSTGAASGWDVVEPAQTGDTLVTSLAVPIQRAVEDSLATRLSSQTGSAIVLDAKTGRVLALASHPDYDPDLWVDGVSNDEYDALVATGALLNHALQSLAAPGSIWKSIAVLAMQREGMDLSASYQCPARYRAGSGVFTNHDSIGAGSVSLAKALEISCNTVFYRVADKFWSQGGGERSSATELDPIALAGTDLGLAAPTGIDLPDEASGSIASPAAKQATWQARQEMWCAAAESGYPELAQQDPARARYFRKLDRENCTRGDRWQQGDAINAAIGQGGTATSVVAMASAYAALLGDGRLRTPTVGRAILSADGDVSTIDPTVGQARVVPPEVTGFLRKALSRVTKSGTAKAAFADFPLDKIPVAGKTGTAQVDGKEATAWFAAAAPANDPQYVVVASVPQGGDGGSTAAPIVRSIYDGIFGLNGNPGVPSDAPNYTIPSVGGVPSASEVPSVGAPS
ncbi:MAG: penicillin-binding protein 2 [Actinomycetia bacterium]|nr:penicillin-binding protein 2 [Actinomycetes bacterium]